MKGNVEELKRRFLYAIDLQNANGLRK